jgi:hypothetical protein
VAPTSRPVGCSAVPSLTFRWVTATSSLAIKQSRTKYDVISRSYISSEQRNCENVKCRSIVKCHLFNCRNGGEDFENYVMIYLLTAIGLTPGGSSAVHIYTQTVHRTTQTE